MLENVGFGNVSYRVCVCVCVGMCAERGGERGEGWGRGFIEREKTVLFFKLGQLPIYDQNFSTPRMWVA